MGSFSLCIEYLSLASTLIKWFANCRGMAIEIAIVILGVAPRLAY